ncbi:MAG TPA: methyltransferase domain-containing protein [Pyrinomonadaceae bacterium]|nr:methyltransferase domain-containing protein [Pyrinomonadaceae bacterium]
MRDGLKDKYESYYLHHLDPWDYWKSTYEIRKYREQISLVAQFGAPKRILEIACSTGAHTKLIHEAFPEATITAVDISSTAIARASKYVNAPQSITFHAADIFSFAETLEPRSIDVIFWSEAFEFLHEYCTIAEFSRLVRRLNISLTPNGVLCISHIIPKPFSYPAFEAGRKNIRVFHDLIRDYFREAVSATNLLRKEEVDNIFRYEVRLYRPRLLDVPRDGGEQISIDQVDVVIPARNEAKTITDVISKIQHAAKVGRVIVVNNGSSDGTGVAAAATGAFVADCPEQGYGRAVKRGVQESDCRWILKLDADIENANSKWVELLIECATRSNSRLAKTYWTESHEDPNGVTNFTAKPAFRLFFPELLRVRNPLSRIYLFDKYAFDLQQLPNDFSFDVAMLISALKTAQTISQVEIEMVKHSTISNGRRTYEHYYKMSDEVLTYIVEAGLERLAVS